MKHVATAKIVSDPWIPDYPATGSHGVVMVRVRGQIMKHCSGSRGLILCTTGIAMVPKAKTTSSQRQKACDIAAHASQICATNNYRKGVRKRYNKKRKKHHESLHLVLSPLSLNFISSVDLTGYTIFSHGGAIDNPPIKILNLHQETIPSRLFQ